MTAMDRLQFERDLFSRGITCIAGVDEAGRGPLAGPVVAAAVVFPGTWIAGDFPIALAGLNDSKQVTEKRREEFFDQLNAFTEIESAVALIDADVIDRINILQATHRAMQNALDQLPFKPAHALVDGRPVKSLRFPQTAIVKGDSKSYSIAAASILAKVTRDRLMLKYHDEYPLYGFAEHKGYGTARHLAAIEAHGPCPIHRKSFAPLKQKQAELF